MKQTSGWHFPTMDEWYILSDELGGWDMVSETMKVGGSSGFEGHIEESISMIPKSCLLKKRKRNRH